MMAVFFFLFVFNNVMQTLKTSKPSQKQQQRADPLEGVFTSHEQFDKILAEAP